MSEFVLLGEGKSQVRLDIENLERIGGGGEGDIYACSNDQCIKILTDPFPDRIRVLISHVKRDPAIWEGVGRIAATPLSLVYDETGQDVRGYSMRRLTAWECLGDIMTRDSSKQAGVGMKEKATIFLALQRAVTLVHKQGFIIGDFNSSNVYFHFAGEECEITFIDTDSWSVNRPDIDLVYFPGVTDEMELYHPDFLLADLEGKAHPPANQNHDWWAFSYLFWKALTKHDPFTGGEIQGETKDSRLANIMAGVDSHLDFETNREIALSTLRLGPIMQNTLNRFLTLKFRSTFPALLIERFRDEICVCPECSEEMSYSAVFCPNCLEVLEFD